MQNKGIVIVTAVLLTLASIFYLSFSAASSYFDKKAAEIEDPIAQQDYKAIRSVLRHRWDLASTSRVV